MAFSFFLNAVLSDMGLFVNQKVSRNPHFFLCIENEIAMGIRNVMGQRWDKTSTNSKMVHHLMAIGNVDLMGFNGISHDFTKIESRLYTWMVYNGIYSNGI